jgi:hypothetical protein
MQKMSGMAAAMLTLVDLGLSAQMFTVGFSAEGGAKQLDGH